ncbi:MAG: hypothetical protein SCG72_01420 [Nitrosarchaeum sp.]|nr:hypothetical protein [Nitrosarchaeum sp.]
MDLIATNESPSQVSDKIKDLLFSKSAERLENMRSAVASQLFGENESEEESEDEDDEEEDGDEDN